MQSKLEVQLESSVTGSAVPVLEPGRADHGFVTSGVPAASAFRVTSRHAGCTSCHFDHPDQTQTASVSATTKKSKTSCNENIVYKGEVYKFSRGAMKNWCKRYRSTFSVALLSSRWSIVAGQWKLIEIRLQNQTVKKPILKPTQRATWWWGGWGNMDYRSASRVFLCSSTLPINSYEV